jgi:transposase
MARLLLVRMDGGDEMARRTFTVIDICEILQHWYAGRPKVEVARSLGVSPKTVRCYVRPAEEAGMVPGGPPVSEEEWRRLIRAWFPERVDSRLRRRTWATIEAYHDTIASLVGVVPVSVIYQRLRDEAGLDVSLASVRRYVWAQFEETDRRASVTVMRPTPPPGEECQVDYGYLGVWFDPVSGRRRRLWAFSMVCSHSRHLFIKPVLVMDQAAWVEAHIGAFEFFGGCPRRLVPDNLRAGVVKADLYDPKINRAYGE